MKKIFLLIFLAGIVTLGRAQNLPHYFEPGFKGAFELKSNFVNPADEKAKYDHLSSAIIHRNYDVLRYDLYMDWYDVMLRKGTLGTERLWSGSNKITVVIDSADVNTLSFDAGDMQILSIMVNSFKLTSTPQPSQNLLKVNLPYTFKKGDTVSVTINYQYTGATDLGFYISPEKLYIGTLSNGDSVWVESRLAYTMSEPEDARYWMPCNDSPHDKAISTISVRVPKEFTAVSNGLISKIDEVNDYKIFTWKDNTPIPTYLMAVTASKFATFSHWYKKVTNPKDSVEIQYYVWQKDFDATKTDQTQYNAHNTFKSVADMMAAYSSKFIEYPFVKYGMVAIMPFSFGGMEHQTITSINRVWMRTNEQNGIAHELGHQWLGDLITCATWKDIWINEGGATWTEAIWAEKQWGSDGYMNAMYWKRYDYLRSGGLKLPAIYNLPINTIFGNNAVLVYQKASWVYHQLRTMLGDSVFFPALRSLMRKYAYGSLESEDFRNHFISEVKNPPIDLLTYFEQWLKSPGHPVYDVSVVTSKPDALYNHKFTIQQVQTGNNIPSVFQQVIRLHLWKGGKYEMDTVVIKNGIETFSLKRDFIPDSIRIDTTFSLLEVKGILTAVQERKEGGSLMKMEISPNPVSESNVAVVSVPVKSFGNISLELYDNSGRRIKSIYNNILPEGDYKFNLPTEELPSGIYLLIMRNGVNIETTQFVVVK